MERDGQGEENLLNYFITTLIILSICSVHKDFFDEMCKDCKAEYAILKGHTSSDTDSRESATASGGMKKYKEFSEERARRLYEQLLLQFLNSPYRLREVEAAQRARYIIKKQCSIRDIPIWTWLK